MQRFLQSNIEILFLNFYSGVSNKKSILDAKCSAIKLASRLRLFRSVVRFDEENILNELFASKFKEIREVIKLMLVKDDLIDLFDEIWEYFISIVIDQ